MIAASPFHGEGHRKIWARLRVQGLRTSKRRTLVVMHAADSDHVAAARGRLDAMIAGLLFMGGLRRSEVAALRWADVADAGDVDGLLVTVRRSKTNPEGATNDVRYLKDGVARRVTAHSGRVGLASELTRRGASTTDVMIAGHWKTSRMVAHYSAGATAATPPAVLEP